MNNKPYLRVKDFYWTEDLSELFETTHDITSSTGFASIIYLLFDIFERPKLL